MLKQNKGTCFRGSSIFTLHSSEQALFELVHITERLLYIFWVRCRIPLFHCNVIYVSLFNSYYNGFCSNKIRELVLENHVFLLNTCHSLYDYSPTGRADVITFWLLKNENGIKCNKIIRDVGK